MSMKKKFDLLGIFSALSIAAASLLGATVLKSEKEADLVGAAGTIDIYCTQNHDWANDEPIRVYQWGGSTAGTANWDWSDCSPMSFVFNNEYEQKVYKLTIPSDRTGIIFWYRQGTSTKQSTDVTSLANNKGWSFTDDWTGDGKNKVNDPWTVYPYTVKFNGNGYTSGSMTDITAYGNVQWGLPTNGFVRTGMIFDSWNTQADGNGTKYYNEGLLPKKENTSEITLYARWRKPYTSGRYVVDSDLNMDNATLMTYTNNQYVATVTLSYKQAFKSAWYNNDNGVLDNWFGYSRLYSGCGAYHYLSVDEEDNIVCYARGTYIIYVNNDNISIELENANVLTSEHLAAQLMSFGESPSTGHCGDADRFPTMRSIYLNKLNATEKSRFQDYINSSEAQFKNAYDRYTAWARALGEDPWSSGKANGVASLIGLTTNTTNNVTLLVIISVVSVGAIGGYFFIRRRKETN